MEYINMRLINEINQKLQINLQFLQLKLQGV